MARERNPPPALSVVIGACNAGAVIADCLGALAREPDADAREVILADSSTDDTVRIARAFPSVQLLHTDSPRNLAQLRGAGIAAARGTIIAVLDPYAIVAPGWQAHVLAAHSTHTAPVIGGAVELADDDMQEFWTAAQFINEYGMFMPPVHEGPALILPGCNITYKRAALYDGETPRFDEFWKTFVNEGQAAAAPALWLDGAIRVTLRKPIPASDFLRTRFHHGRVYAAMRSREWSHVTRLLHGLGTPLLPFVLYARWSRVYWGKHRRRAQLVRTTPAQLVLFGNWALGELAGYLAGAGHSSARLTY